MALPGKHAGVLIGGTPMLEISEATFTINGEVVDVSTFDSDGWRERILNLRDATISLSGFYDPSDTTGQVALRDAQLAQDVVEDVQVRADASVASTGLECDAVVETFEINPTVEGAVAVSITLQSTGPITIPS
jgi:predicted secreted protein